jgi:hypothetical protein
MLESDHDLLLLTEVYSKVKYNLKNENEKREERRETTDCVL